MSKKGSTVPYTKPSISHDDYLSTIEKVINSIESIISEIDSDIINNFFVDVPMNYQHDMMPIMKKLKDAKKEAELSLKLNQK